jgi:glycosyltransferase involved in cell wall biosynthesis
MNILSISQNDIEGGAHRAAYRIHIGLNKFGINNKMLTKYKKSNDKKVLCDITFFSKLKQALRERISQFFNKLLYFNPDKITDNPFLSSNYLPSFFSSKINKSEYEIINLHWVGNDMMSIEDIGRINKPIVWTFHDMWPFCGVEHYYNEYSKIDAPRWVTGYQKKGVFDLSRDVFLRKKKNFNNLKHIVCPSNWLADCVKKSFLFNTIPVSVIPNPVDQTIFKPLEKNIQRKKFSLDKKKKIILFGSSAGIDNYAKGFNFFLKSLFFLKEKYLLKDILVIVFGSKKNKILQDMPYEYLNIGYINNDNELCSLYNTADIIVIPSVTDNLPQVATEAQMCGIPIVAFKTGGLIDIVDHKINGYLANAKNSEDFARGIAWILSKKEDEFIKMKNEALKKANLKWKEEIIINQYVSLYRNILTK